jgi:hypothetical protein
MFARSDRRQRLGFWQASVTSASSPAPFFLAVTVAGAVSAALACGGLIVTLPMGACRGRRLSRFQKVIRAAQYVEI